MATVPDTILTSGPTGVISTRSATFSFEAAVGSGSSDPASFQCRLDTTSAAAWTACTSPTTYNGLAEGHHKFEVRTKNGEGDGAGNFDPTPAVADFSVEIPPETTIDSGPSGPTASAAATFGFSSSEGGGFQCRLDAAGDWETCTSPQSYSGLSQGSHSFEVRAVDSDGNVDPTPASATFSVDTVSPETTIDSGPSATINAAATGFSFSSSESGSFECRLDSSFDADWSTCTSPDSLTGLTEGSHSFEVRAVDEVGNVDPTPAVATFSVDTVSPETTIDSGPAALIDVAEASFAFSSPDEGSFECRLDSSFDADWSTCTSPDSLTGLTEGSHSFEVRAVDSVGNVDPTPAVANFLVDTIPPEIEVDAAPGTTVNVAQAAFTFSSTEPGTFECRLDSIDDADWAPCTSPVVLTDLPEGSHRFEVRAVDEVGNVDPTPAVASFLVDTIAPETKIDSAPAPTIDVAEAAFAFNSTEPGGFECRLDSSADASWSSCGSPDSLAGLAEGTHTFEVRAVDGAGNADATPASATFFVDTPVNGVRLAVSPLTGKVKVKTPDIKRFRPLTEGETIPVGSLVDTTEGKVRLASVNATGEEQWASFSEGTFRVGQKLGSGLVALKLRGRLDCSAGDEASSSAARSGRRLWGSGKGNFRTTGSSGSATVRGTIWFTEDRCDGTFFKVTRGIVAVRDFPRHKTVSVSAGDNYFAQAANQP
jgi:hypothetical protein